MSVSRTPAPRVVLTGATGAIGPAVAAAFLEAGWQVVAVIRSPDARRALPDGCDARVGDLFDDRVLAGAMTGAAAVVHLAGLLHVIDPAGSLDPEYTRVNVGGTQAVVDAARASGVGRIVLASTIAVYGPTRGRIVDETEPPRPDTAYARSKLEAERVVLSRGAANGPSGVVLRLAAVYGGRVKGNYETLVRALSRGRFVPLGRGVNHRTVVHEQDAAHAFVLAATHPAAPERVFNVTDGRVHTVAAMMDAICRGLERRSPRWAVPVGVGRVAAMAMETAFPMIGRRAPVTRRSLEKYLEDVEVSGDAMIRDVGFSPRWSLEAGWANAIGEMRRLGKI